MEKDDAPVTTKPVRKWWRWLAAVLLPLFAIISLVALFPQWWINQPWLRAQIVTIAAQQGVTLTYGNCRLASDGSGLHIDHLSTIIPGIQATCDRLQLNGSQGVRIHHMKIVLDASLLQPSAAGDGSFTLAIPPIFAPLLIGRGLEVDQLELSTPYGNLTTHLRLSILPQFRVGIDLTGQWSILWQGQMLAGRLTTNAMVDPQQGSASVASLRVTMAGGTLLLDHLHAAGLLTAAPHSTAERLTLQLEPAQLPSVLQPLLPSLMQRVTLTLAKTALKVVKKQMTIQTLLQTLRMDAADGSNAQISGDIYASMNAQQLALTLPALTVDASLPQPDRWGMPLHHALAWQGVLKSAITLTSHGEVTLQQLALTGAVTFDKQQWQTHVNATQARWRDHRLQIHDAAIALQGNAALLLDLAYPLPAGGYRLAVHRGDLTIDDGIQWRGDSAIDLAFARLPPLHADIVASLQQHEELLHIDQFILHAPDLKLGLTWQGSLDSRGLDQLASNAHLVLSIADFQPLQHWAALLLPKITIPKLSGTLNSELDLTGRGHHKVQLTGAIDLDGIGFKRSQLEVRGAKMHLPFQQQITLPSGMFTRHSVARSALYQLTDEDLQGDLTIATIEMDKIAINKLHAHLLWDQGVLLTKVDSGMLLGGHVDGYLQLELPKTRDKLPPLFARLHLQQVDSAHLIQQKGLQQKQKQSGRLNIFSTVISDGKSVGVRLSVPQIKRATMGHLIDWLDPKQQDGQLQQVKSLMVDHHFAPSSLDARLRHRFLDVDVALRSKHGTGQIIPIHNLAVGHLLPW